MPPSNRLEALKGKRSGQHSIRINDQWRLCFRFVEGNAHDVEITDYHYRASMMTKKGIQPIHPGAFLSEILEELGLSQAAFAQKIGVSPMRISHVVNGKRPVTAELALLFGKAFGQSPEYWLNLQAAYDLKTAAASVEPRLRTLRKLVA